MLILTVFTPPQNRGSGPPLLSIRRKIVRPPPHLDAVNPTFFRKSGSSFQKPPPFLENGHFWPKMALFGKNPKKVEKMSKFFNFLENLGGLTKSRIFSKNYTLIRIQFSSHILLFILWPTIPGRSAACRNRAAGNRVSGNSLVSSKSRMALRR